MNWVKVERLDANLQLYRIRVRIRVALLIPTQDVRLNSPPSMLGRVPARGVGAERGICRAFGAQGDSSGTVPILCRTSKADASG